jgi:aminopeptidase N
VTYRGQPSVYAPHTTSPGFTAQGAEAVVIGEPHAAATWFPVNDHPLDKATYQIAVTVPRDVEAIVSGKPEGKTSNADNTDTWRWSLGQPAASYLVSMVIGQYTVTRSTHKGKPMLIAVPDGMVGSAADESVKHTGTVADFLETQFGPYPFDAYGAVVIAGKDLGFALESQGRPFYGPGFFEQGVADWVIAHELAHQWFGDSVSVHYWRDVWLNEGFATYAEWLWREHAEGQLVADTAVEAYLEVSRWDRSITDPGADRNFDSTSVYQRGALVLQALRVEVGDDAFFRILKGWAQAKRYGNASSAEFVAYAEQISGRNLKAVFDTWLYSDKKPARPHW